MKNNFKATKTVIALAVAGLMAGAAFAAENETPEAPKNVTTIVDTTDTAKDIEGVTNEVTSNRVSAEKGDFGAIYFDSIGKNTGDIAWEIGSKDKPLIFSGNVSSGKGGALTIDNSTISTTNAQFTHNTAAGQGGAIRLWAGEGKESALTLNYTKDVLISGNRADVGNGDNLAANGQAGMGFQDQGGFAYLKGNSTLTINADKDVTVTIGQAGSAANVDSIASLTEAGSNTVKFTGAGTINMNGSMEAFTGTINVGEGTTLNLATGFGSFDNATQAAANALTNKDSNASLETTKNSLNIEADAVVNVNDVLEITAETDVTVGDGAEFNVDGIVVAPTEYTDKYVDEDEEAYAKAISSAAKGKLTANGGDVTVKHDIVVNGTGATYTIDGTQEGYVNVQGSIQALQGTVTISGPDVDATSIVLGQKGETADKDTVGNITVAQGTTLATNSISAAIAEKDKTQSKLTVNGTLETLSSNIYTIGEDDKATQAAYLAFGQDSTLALTDNTFDKTLWENLESALGEQGPNFYFDTATYIAGENETIDRDTLNEYKRLGHAIVVRGGAATQSDGTALTNLDASEDPYTLGAFDFKIAADATGTDKWTLEVGDADHGKPVFRGTEDGRVFINAGDATIKLTNMAFGQEADDHGTINNKVQLNDNINVEAGTFTFAKKVDLAGKELFAKNGSSLILTTVKAGSGTVIADDAHVTYLGDAEAFAETGVLEVNGAVTAANGGTYVVGSSQGKAVEKSNTVYLGQKTKFNNHLNFGRDTSDTAEANLLVVDMGAVAANGFDTEKDWIVTANQTNVNTTNKTLTVKLDNLNASITTQDVDEETGYNTYTLNFGDLKVATEGAKVAYEAGNANTIFNTKMYDVDALAGEDAGKLKISANEGLMHQLEEENSGLASVMMTELDTLTPGSNALTAKIWSLNEETAAELLGYKNADEMNAALVDADTSLSEITMDAGEDVTLGGIISGAFSASIDYANEVAKTLDRRTSIANLNVERNPSGLTAWVDVFGSANEAKSLFDDSDGHYGYETDVYGAMLGFDWVAPCGAVIGAAVNVGQADSNSVGDFATKSDADSDYYGFNIYAAHQIGNFNGKVDVGYIHSKNDISTKTFFGNFDETLDGDIFTIGLGAEYLANVGAFNVVPHAGLRWSRLDMDDSEYGADYDAMNIYQMPMGVTFSGTFETAGMKVAPMVDISVVPAFGDKDAVASFAGGYSESIRVIDTNPVQLTLGVNGQAGAWTFGINYGLTAGGEDRLNNSLNANARYTF